MALQIIRNNIINVEADAIVNTANPKVAVGRGVDLVIYEAAGYEKLFAAREEIGEMEPGQAAYTPAFDLKAKYIIHTVGPAWRGGDYGERETVASCYRNSLELAKKLKCESIAFPLIATGTYGFPKDEALRIAIAEISGFLLGNEMEVMLVVYDKESFRVSGKLFSDIRMYIGDSDVEEMSLSEASRRSALSGGSVGRASGNMSEPLYNRSAGNSYTGKRRRRRRQLFGKHKEEEAAVEEACTDAALPFPSEERSLEERVWHMDKKFQEYLFMLIDRKGLTDPEVYKKANIDRKHFSKIRSNPDYMPSKRTALALALALELSLDETKDLLARAGLALSPSILFDIIIEYCIKSKNYDIYDINCILFEYDQPMLGA